MVNDFIYVTPESQGLSSNKILEFKKESEMDIVIVTTNDLKGFQLPEYTYNFYDYNDFATNGVTLIIYTGGKSPEIFMGNSGKKDGFIFTTYNETRVNQTLSYIYNGNIVDGNYYEVYIIKKRLLSTKIMSVSKLMDASEIWSKKEKNISNYSSFIQQNLMPVIRGEKWE